MQNKHLEALDVNRRGMPHKTSHRSGNGNLIQGPGGHNSTNYVDGCQVAVNMHVFFLATIGILFWKQYDTRFLVVCSFADKSLCSFYHRKERREQSWVLSSTESAEKNTHETSFLLFTLLIHLPHPLVVLRTEPRNQER